MRTPIKHFFIHAFACLALAMAIMLASCDSKDGPKPEKPDVKKATILLYAIASNNLYENLISDKEEILQGANSANLEEASLLIYQVTPSGNPLLLELVKNSGGELDYKVVKEYDRSLYSTDPERVKEVIDDALDYRPADYYGLFLWSHGMGIDYTSSTHPKSSVPTRSSDDNPDLISSPQLFWFGADKNSELDNRYTDYANIDEFASSIPDDTFDFIWFDACYMSGIETMYQFRNKCNKFVAYPTEVLAEGMPYDKTMPYILRSLPDIEGAAKAFFYYFEEEASYQMATIAVCDMQYIEDVAEASSLIYSKSGSVSTSGLQTYSRGTTGPFYDFAQVSRIKAGDDNDVIISFNKALKNFVIWAAATDIDFNYHAISKENYSGISTFLFDPQSTSNKNKYYKTLDWYKRVYQ